MKDIHMYCVDLKCVCEDKCCQACDENKTCPDKCENSKYKDKVYASDEYLLNELTRLAGEKESWLVAVAVEKIKELQSQLSSRKY